MHNQRGVYVRYSYCVSLLIITLSRESEPVFVPDGESRVIPGLKYSLLSFVLGWWGFPFGLIYTPWAIFTNFSGGREVGSQ